MTLLGFGVFHSPVQSAALEVGAEEAGWHCLLQDLKERKAAPHLLENK